MSKHCTDRSSLTRLCPMATFGWTTCSCSRYGVTNYLMMMMMNRTWLMACERQPDSPASLPDVVLIDYQVMSVSDIVNDLTSFFLSNLSPELMVRDSLERFNAREHQVAHREAVRVGVLLEGTPRRIVPIVRRSCDCEWSQVEPRGVPRGVPKDDAGRNRDILGQLCCSTCWLARSRLIAQDLGIRVDQATRHPSVLYLSM